VQLVGFIAGALTTAAFVPQVVKSWRTRSVDDFSLGMLLMFGAGVALWLVYGWLNDAVPIVVANGLTLLLTLPLLALKFTGSARRRAAKESVGVPVAESDDVDEVDPRR
jgi:MtN3 and saliva related transmembrane protein